MRNNQSIDHSSHPPVKEVTEEIKHKHWSPWEITLGLAGLGMTIALAVLPIVYKDSLMATENVSRYGLAGTLIVSFIASSAFSMTAVPVPYWVLTFTLPGILAEQYGIMAPVWVALATAVGASLAQFLTFIIAWTGRGFTGKMAKRFGAHFFEKAAAWTRRNGGWTIFLMSVTTNPLHLPMTVAIATLHYPPFAFLFFSFLGMIVKSLVLAFAGYYSMTSLLKILQMTSAVLPLVITVGGVILLLAIWQLLVTVIEDTGKRRKFKAATAHARKQGKQLLVIGGPWGVQPARRWLNMPAHEGGDVCLDIDRRALEGHVCPVVASAVSIPFGDKTFGAVFLSHVLEHLPSPGAARQAIEEMNRVAEAVFLVYPSRQSIAAWIIRDHRIWVWRKGNLIYLQQRGGRGKKETLIVEAGSQTV